MVALILFLIAGNAIAQQLATLNVTVNDQSGAGVPGASVTLKNKDTGATRTATTGEGGLVVVAGLPAGLYDLTAEHPGLSPRTVPVQLTVGQVATLTVSLSVTARAEKVEVTETVQGVDPEKAEVSQVIDTPKIADLPISGRDFIDFVLLTPSVNIGRSTAVGAQSPFTETVLKLSFGGVRETHTSFFSLDGIDYTTSISGVQRVSPSQDWVQEFRVVNSPYTGDNGRNLGSVVNTVTKSGSNDVHGSLYEFFRNNNLDAKNLLSGPGFTTLRFNQFGGTVGGPIKKDKIFFFGGYEGQRRAESPIYSKFILNGIDNPGFGPGTPSINQVKTLLGLGTESLSSILSIDDYDKFIVKTNSVISEKTFLNVAYLFNDSRKKNVRGAAPGEGLPSSYRDNPVRDQTVYGSLIHLFSPTLTSETLAQYGRRTFDLIPKGEGFEPALIIPDLMSSGGFVGSVRNYTEQRFQIAENMTYVHGNHTFKFGGDVQPVWIDTLVTLFSPGVGIFPPPCFFGVAAACIQALGTTPTVLPPAMVTPGTAAVFLFLEPRQFFGSQIPARTLPFQAGLYAGPSQQTFLDSTRLKFEHTLWSLYAQDHWKIRPNLTLTVGLHYDVDTFPSAKDIKITGPGGGPGGFHPTNYNNVQPRVSLAYSFNGGKSVVRAGFGIFDSPFVFSDVLVSWIGASEFTYMNNPNLPEFANPASQLIGFGASGAVGAPSITGLLPPIPCNPPVLVPPACGGPPLFVQQALALQASTTFSNFSHNGVYPSPTPSPINPAGLLQFPLGYAKKKFDNPFAEQASLEIEHQFARDYFVSVGYQYMHATRLPVYFSINGTAAAAPFPTCNPLVASGCQPYFSPIPTDPNFGFVLYVKPSAFSIYHAGTLSVRKAFTHHFNFLANYTYSKSIDISTTINLPNVPANYLHSNLDRAVGDNNVPHRFTLAALAESPDTWNVVLRNFKASVLTNLQAARRFSIVAGFDTNNDHFPFPDRVGTIGRNTYRGDPTYTVDMRLQRVIPFTERIKGEASVEVFNLLNRANVLDLDHAYGAPDFIPATAVPKHYKDGIGSVGNPSFGSPKFVAEARQIQLSFRLNF